MKNEEGKEIQVYTNGEEVFVDQDEYKRLLEKYLQQENDRKDDTIKDLQAACEQKQEIINGSESERKRLQRELTWQEFTYDSKPQKEGLYLCAQASRHSEAIHFFVADYYENNQTNIGWIAISGKSVTVTHFMEIPELKSETNDT